MVLHVHIHAFLNYFKWGQMVCLPPLFDIFFPVHIDNLHISTLCMQVQFSTAIPWKKGERCPLSKLYVPVRKMITIQNSVKQIYHNIVAGN